MAKKMELVEATISIIGKKGELKGWLSLTPGFITYTRPRARKKAAAWCTYQQLIDWFEDQIKKKKTK